MFTKSKHTIQQVARNKSTHRFFQEVHREGNHWATNYEPNLWLVMADSWEVMDYLLYSLDLVSSDFCLFGSK